MHHNRLRECPDKMWRRQEATRLTEHSPCDRYCFNYSLQHVSKSLKLIQSRDRTIAVKRRIAPTSARTLSGPRKQELKAAEAAALPLSLGVLEDQKRRGAEGIRPREPGSHGQGLEARSGERRAGQPSEASPFSARHPLGLAVSVTDAPCRGPWHGMQRQTCMQLRFAPHAPHKSYHRRPKELS